jgi:hypothetical protein
MKIPIALILTFLLTATGLYAQRPRSGSSATSVTAELIKGKLNPAESKPGDQITVRLKEDVKSNGDVVLKKGTTINGVIQHVERSDKADSNSAEQSFIQIHWLEPNNDEAPSREMMIAIQSVTQSSRVSLADAETESESVSPRNQSPRGHGLVNVSSVTSVNASNTALLNMPTVVAADPQTATELQKALGVEDGQPLFETGHGQSVSPGGYRESIDIFSYLNNDTVLTSHSKNFELSRGAQLRLLVGMHKK